MSLSSPPFRSVVLATINTSFYSAFSTKNGLFSLSDNLLLQHGFSFLPSLLLLTLLTNAVTRQGGDEAKGAMQCSNQVFPIQQKNINKQLYQAGRWLSGKRRGRGGNQSLYFLTPGFAPGPYHFVPVSRLNNPSTLHYILTLACRLSFLVAVIRLPACLRQYDVNASREMQNAPLTPIYLPIYLLIFSLPPPVCKYAGRPSLSFSFPLFLPSFLLLFLLLYIHITYPLFSSSSRRLSPLVVLVVWVLSAPVWQWISSTSSPFIWARLQKINKNSWSGR